MKPQNNTQNWLKLIAVSIAVIAAFTYINVPAAGLTGGMVAGIIISQLNINLKLPGFLFLFAQTVIGLMISKIFTAAVLHRVMQDWVLVLTCVFLVLACSFALGMILTKKQILPKTTAIWGTWPGAASVMSVMAESYGADMRLVALMQYLRVGMVALLASGVSLYYGIETSSHGGSFLSHTFAGVPFIPFILTLTLCALCIFLAKKTKFAAGPMVIAMVLGTVANNTLTEIQTPQWLLLFSYIAIGWQIGLRFTREIIVYALKTLPAIMSSIILLLLFCGFVAALMVVFGGISPLTAYLAASPGGADSIAIIAAAADVDMAFVMSVQMTRFAAILFIAPFISKMVLKKFGASAD